jgi:glycosyltransferase involved in cell wall biosynthesis
MRIAVTYGPMCLQRSAVETWNDPRTGSEVGWRRIADGLKAVGHDATAHIGSYPQGSRVDCVIAINEPDRLREFTHAKLRVCMFWLNRFEFCQEGFDKHVDIYCSPSQAHLDQVLGAWGAQNPEKWVVNQLGCDSVQDAAIGSRVRGRVVYCSSPDRGLHRVLEAWPTIKRACPEASLRIFYRLEPWLRGFDQTPYYPPIEKLRTRAHYVEQALEKLSGPEWGIEVVDSVSHDQMMREMAMAEVLVHPCETTSWSEGFSCTVLEGCAAQACPIVSDCDALGEVYADIEPFKVGDWGAFRDLTIRALTDSAFREYRNKKAKALADRLTWKAHVARLDEVIREKINR